MGAAGELVFPALLIAGLTSRLGAVGLFAVNVMAVVSYADVLLAEGFEAALGQHYMWGFGLVVLIVFGPGKVSLLGPSARARAEARAEHGAGTRGLIGLRAAILWGRYWLLRMPMPFTRDRPW